VTARSYLASGGQWVPLTGGSTQAPPETFLVGAWSDNLAEFQGFSAESGPLYLRRVFNPNVPSSWPGAGPGNDGNSGKPWTIFQSVKAPPAEIVAGVWDSAIANFVSGGPTDRDWYFTIWHEPEDDVKNSPANWPELGTTFRKIHERMYPIVKAANARVLMGPVWSYWQWRPDGGLIQPSAAAGWRPQDWIPDPSVADFYGIDEYNATFSGSQRRSLANSEAFLRWYSLMPTSRPIALPEWGRFPDPTDPTRRAAEITESAQWLRDSGRCILWAYWNAIGTEGDYELHDIESQEAWRNVAQSGKALTL
jgi:hypothetical protein